MSIPFHALLGACVLGLLLVAPPAGLGAHAPSGLPTAAASVRTSPLLATPTARAAAGLPWPFHGVDRSGTEYACIQGWGYGDGPYNLTSVQAIRSWNVSAVRVPLNEDCWLDLNVNGTSAAAWSGAGYRAFIVAYVDLLESQGIRPILDLHWNAPGTNQSVGQEPMVDESHGPAFWSSVAYTFRNDPLVIFDLYNEPYGISWDCWLNGCFQTSTSPGWQTAGMQQLVDVVRAAGADSQLLMLGGLNYSNDDSGWLSHMPTDPAGPGLLAASAHVYDFNACDTFSCWNATLLPIVRAGIPLVTGELGESDCNATFIDRYFAWADPLHVSYLGWTWDAWNTCNGPTLIASYNGTPYMPYGAGFRAHLLGFPAPVLAPPTAPTAVAAAAGNRSVQVDWGLPSSNGTWPVSAYQVGWGASDGSYTSNLTVGPSDFQENVTGLANGQTYWVAVRAENAIGWGPWSAGSSAVPVSNVSVVFLVAPLSGTSPLNVSFHAIVRGGTPPYLTTWDFGDGNVAPGPWGNHTYAQGGSYPVELGVDDAVRSWGFLPGPTVQVATPGLQAKATASVSEGASPLTVQFTGSATGGTGTYAYAWAFGDGGTSSLQDPTHIFHGNVSWSTTLWVNTSTGGSARAVVPIVSFLPLTVTLGSNVSKGPSPLSVAFHATAQAGDPGYQFTWNFGDGTTATGPNVVHAFTGAGKAYVVNLTGTDAAGDTAWATTTIITSSGACNCGPSQGTTPPSPTWYSAAPLGIANGWLLAIGASALVAAVVAIAMRARLRTGPPVTPEGPEPFHVGGGRGGGSVSEVEAPGRPLEVPPPSPPVDPGAPRP